MKSSECSGRTLAFLGDAVWSLLVREYLISKGEGKGNDLQRKSTHYVSAKAQHEFYEILHEEGFLSEVEEEYYRRGRNSNSGSHPKNTDVLIYRSSTGFEAMIGGLWLDEDRERIGTIWDKVRTLKEE